MPKPRKNQKVSPLKIKETGPAKDFTTPLDFMPQDVTFYSQGIKPKCVESRWFSTYVDETNHCIILEEYYLDYNTAKCLGKESYTINLPEDFKDRIIGKPVCIGSKGDHVILQFIKGRDPYLHFMHFNIATNAAQMFEDEAHYFNRGFTSLYSVECLISPGLTSILFRLPQPVMSDRKWSKMLKADIKCDVEKDIFIKNVKVSFLRDRQNQTVAFDPKHPHNVTFILVDTYCSKCHIMRFDVQQRKTLSEKKQMIDHRSAYNKHEVSEADDEDTVSYFLHQCNAAYCQSGDVLVLVCVIFAPTLPEEAMLKISFFDAQELTLRTYCHLKAIRNLPFPMRGLDSSKHWFYPVFSPGDSEVSVWFFQKGAPPIISASSLKVPKQCDLKAMCRTVIMNVCPRHKVQHLPLPSSLQLFLRFEHQLEY